MLFHVWAPTTGSSSVGMIAQGFGNIHRNMRRLARDSGLMQEVAFGSGRDNLTRYSPPRSPVTSYQSDHLFGFQKRNSKKHSALLSL